MSMTIYKIFDTQEGFYYRNEYKTRRAARKRADALDLEYGAVRHMVYSFDKFTDDKSSARLVDFKYDV